MVELIARGRLLSVSIIRKLCGQVPPPGQPASGAAEFSRALMRQRVITGFHSQRLLDGKCDEFFIGEYPLN